MDALVAFYRTSGMELEWLYKWYFRPACLPVWCDVLWCAVDDPAAVPVLSHKKRPFTMEGPAVGYHGSKRECYDACVGYIAYCRCARYRVIGTRDIHWRCGHVIVFNLDGIIGVSSEFDHAEIHIQIVPFPENVAGYRLLVSFFQYVANLKRSVGVCISDSAIVKLFFNSLKSGHCLTPLLLLSYAQING